MTKQEFVDAVAGKSGLSKRDAGEAVDAFLDVVTGRSGGRRCDVHRFRQVPRTKRAARMGVNPRTGAPVHINAATVPKFSAGSQLKKAVNP